jgi:hypothetical protein
MLDTTDLKPCLPYHVAFQIVVAHPTKYFTHNIFSTVVDEGTSTCGMSLVCWKAISQPIFSLSPTLLTSFYGHSFIPHGIIHSFLVQLEGNTMCIEVEVVDVSLHYNLLLGRSWTYAVHAMVATVFRLLLFRHEGRIITIDQWSFSRPDPSSGASTVPMIDNPQPRIINVGVGFFPYLMGTFYYPPPSGDIKFISVSLDQPRAKIFQVSSFCMNYFNDLWNLPSPLDSMEGIGHPSMGMPLSSVEVAYSIFQQASVNPDPTPAQELDPIIEPIWAQGSLANIYSLDLVFPSYEVILEELTSLDRPWDDLHHRSYFLPKLRRIEAGEFVLTMTGDRSCLVNPMAMHAIYDEGNMESITETIPIDISRTPSVVENVFFRADYFPEEVRIYIDLFKEFHDVFSWCYKEMRGTDLRIIKNEIMNYPNAKTVRQKLRPVNPRKVAVIKAEVEKLLKVSFIYPIQLTQWVSNIVPINKKLGMIHVCMDLCDLNKACPKDNFPTQFID